MFTFKNDFKTRLIRIALSPLCVFLLVSSRIRTVLILVIRGVCSSTVILQVDSFSLLLYF